MMFPSLFLFICCFSIIESSLIDSKTKQTVVNGTQFSMKNMISTYRQIVSNQGRCAVELEQAGEPLKIISEGEIVKIKGKWFKVEQCRLNRAYMMPCHSRLFRQTIQIVCTIVGNASKHKVTKRQTISDDFTHGVDEFLYDDCCHSACTISELFQYCVERD